MKCDIIVPVYNAYDCLTACFDSVINNTDLKENRLIIIDDKSPDPKVLPLLERYSEKDGIILLKNEENLGFVGTVNKGMKLSAENDVLLLNSDTEVTAGWLDKIKKCAYSNDNVATVTPLSNNATFASVPNTFEANDLPEGYSLNEFADIVEKASFRDYPEVPTGHGFCLYIKRSALNAVGYFDEESFGKGYGEENDFCYRCLDKGLQHLTCDDTFVLHKESRSFSESKEAQLKQGLELIKKRYPFYTQNLEVWVAKKSLSYIGNNIKLEMGVHNNKPNILFLIHDWNDIDNHIGGTTLHAWDIIRILKKHFNFHVFSPDEGHYKVTSYWADSPLPSIAKFPSVQKFTSENLYNREYAEIAKRIIKLYNISLVHIHHMLSHYFDIFDICKESKIKTIVTLHDYYFVCPTINKLYNNEKYCEDGSESKCSTCLKCRFDTQQRSLSFISAWRRVCHEKLKSCDLVIAPSEAAKQEILITYPDIPIRVIEHGVDIEKHTAVSALSDKAFNVAFIGAIGPHKGYDLLAGLKSCLKKTKIKLHLFGLASSEIPSSKIFTNHGKYKREDLPKLMSENNINLICLFSIWPETYSYTLTEAIASGVPVIAFDFGAIAERIKKYNLGYVIKPTNDPNVLKKELVKIFSDKAAYNDKIAAINAYHIKSTSAMDDEYLDIYSENVKYNSSGIAYEDIKSYTKASLVSQGTAQSADYSWIFNTLKWKVLSRLSCPKFLRDFLKRIITHG